MSRSISFAVPVCLLATSAAFAQDPTGAIEGAVTDTTAAAIAAAHVVARNTETGFTRDAVSGSDVNLGLPVADLNFANFGKILSAGPPRLLQFAAKLIF